MKTALQKAEAQIARCKKALAAAVAERNRQLSKTLVACESSVLGRGCGEQHMIKDLIYIQTHYYIAPYGCSSGDYWLPGEGNFICPTCGNRNRLYDRKEIQTLKHLFKSIKLEHDGQR